MSSPSMTLPAPPSARLPPIRKIREYSIEVLNDLVKYLRIIYNPPVRGTRRIDRNWEIHSLRKVQDDEESFIHLRSDEFERAFTVRWLTGLVAQASLFQDDETAQNHIDESRRTVDALIRDAASLLAVCAGTAAAGTVTRRFSFGTPGLKSPVEVQLTDIPISVDGNAATVGAHTWGSACLLAEMVVESPERFGLLQDSIGRGLRILELGAGTGLVSLALAKLLSVISHSQATSKPTVVATDYHPEVLNNLAYNIKANFSEDPNLGISISAHSLDWSLFSDAAADLTTLVAPLDAPFDIIFGADIIYEPAHARWIRKTVSLLLRRPVGSGAPSDHAEPRFHLLIPLRPTHVSESRTVEEVFPKVPNISTPRSRDSMELCILDVESILCEAEDRRAGAEVEYLYYAIGWA
ncbi:hypothetical protein BD414DRAFT_488762 [Trametes punicea]|nr:hypothetical protein BD414DRAFT_488762 [Trametes punicea]